MSDLYGNFLKYARGPLPVMRGRGLARAAMHPGAHLPMGRGAVAHPTTTGPRSTAVPQPIAPAKVPAPQAARPQAAAPAGQPAAQPQPASRLSNVQTTTWNPGESGQRYQGAISNDLLEPSSVQLAEGPHLPSSATPRANFQAPTGTSTEGAAWDPGALQQRLGSSLANAKTWAQTRTGTALGLAGAGALGYGLYRAGRNSDEQGARMQDYLANSHTQMNQPLPAMSVYASYDEFAREKHADFMPPRVDTFGRTHDALSGALAQSLSRKLVEEPIDAFHRTLKKRLIEDPKAEQSFQAAVQGDPHLKSLYEKNPDNLRLAFKTMRKFSPTTASSPMAVQSFLLNTAMSGGRLDFATIRLLAETEKFVQNAKGRGNP